MHFLTKQQLTTMLGAVLLLAHGARSDGPFGLAETPPMGCAKPDAAPCKITRCLCSSPLQHSQCRCWL